MGWFHFLKNPVNFVIYIYIRVAANSLTKLIFNVGSNSSLYFANLKSILTKKIRSFIMKDKMYVAFKVSLRIKIVGIKVHKSHTYLHNIGIWFS